MSASPSANESRLAGVGNPFADSIVGTVWEPPLVDVPEIHAGVFAELLRVVDARVQGRHDRCLLLYGNAGSGKTHLFRRLRLALELRGEPFLPLSWIWMGTSPAMVWRYLRRNFAADLVWRTAGGKSQLDHLLDTRREKLDQVRRRDLAVVLEHLAAGRHRRDARAWLAGEDLPDAALERMGLAPSDADDATLEDEARQIFEDLAEWIAPTPFVLCLDQLEALQAHPGDKYGLFTIGKLYASTYKIRNAVVIGCAQTGLLGELNQALDEAERDRYRPLALLPLKDEEVRALVRARLATEPEIAARRPRGASEFWPIDMRRLLAQSGTPEGLTARRVLFECDRMFRRAQNVPGVEISLEQFLRREFESRAHDAASRLSPEASSDVLSDGLVRLLHVRGFPVTRERLPHWLDHEVRPAQGEPIGVALVNGRPKALWHKLDKILHGWDPGERRLVLLRDVLHPLGPGAEGTRERFRELERRGARCLAPPREALSALDALRRLLAAAESGELSYQGESPPVQAVEEWIRQNIPDALSRLLDDLLAAGPHDALPHLLADYLGEEKVASVAMAAAALAATPEEVERCARENHHQFGLLLGAEPVVFEKIPPAAGA
jgi:hypothetical protein